MQFRLPDSRGRFLSSRPRPTKFREENPGAQPERCHMNQSVPVTPELPAQPTTPAPIQPPVIEAKIALPRETPKLPIEARQGSCTQPQAVHQRKRLPTNRD